MVLSPVVFVGIVVGLGEMVALATLLLSILVAIVGSYAGVRSALAKQDEQRRSLAAEIRALRRLMREDIRRLEYEQGLSRQRFHDIADFVSHLSMKQGGKPFRKRSEPSFIATPPDSERDDEDEDTNP